MDPSLPNELWDLFKEFEETKSGNRKHTEFNSLLQDELQLAREAEKSTEYKKVQCEGFLNQQQEIIQGLLDVKEENENLKCKLNQAEKTLTMVQNNNIEEQLKHNAKLEKVQQEHLNKIAIVQEETRKQAENEKSELLDTIRELKASVSKMEEILAEKNAEIVSLEEKMQRLKAWSDANIEAFNEKLSEQERQHQSELETWKIAELNRSLNDQNLQNNYNPQVPSLYRSSRNQYQQPPQAETPMQEYQTNIRFQEQMSSYQKKPLVTHLKTVTPKQKLNMVRPLTAFENCKNKGNFVSATDLYMQGHLLASGSSELNNGENMKENKLLVVGTQKSNILIPNKKRKLFNSNQNML